MSKTKIIISVGILAVIGFGFVLWQMFNSGSQLILVPAEGQLSAEDWAVTGQVLEKRLTALGLSAQVQPDGAKQEVAIKFTETLDLSPFIPALTRAGQLEIIEGGIEFPPISATEQIQTGAEAQPDLGIYRFLVQADEFVQAENLSNEGSNFYLRLWLAPSGAERYQAFIDNNYGLYMCLVLDKAIVGCPIIKQSEAKDSLELLPGPTDLLTNSAEVAFFVNSGPLPLALKVVE